MFRRLCTFEMVLQMILLTDVLSRVTPYSFCGQNDGGKVRSTLSMIDHTVTHLGILSSHDAHTVAQPSNVTPKVLPTMFTN